MKNIYSLARRAVAYWRMRDLEIQLNDQLACFPHVKDSLARDALNITILRTRAELAGARTNYVGLLPPGERRTWGVA